MPSRKQKRRRDKTFRHEYGLVTYDDDGNEVEVAATELREKKPEKPKQTTKKGARPVRALREPPLPSWNRALKRGFIWGGVMFLLVMLFFTDMSLGGRIFMGLLYAAAFVPLTYWIDRMAYRNWQKRQARPG
jgi:hypothetical protein